MRRALLALLVALPVAGCTDSIGKLDLALAPDRIGWNVTEVASFTLTASGEGAYTIDPIFAIQSVALDTGGVGGDFQTEKAEELGLELLVDGRPVAEHTLFDAGKVQVRFRLPESLKDDAYTLELVLFQQGNVESPPFRVNRP